MNADLFKFYTRSPASSSTSSRLATSLSSTPAEPWVPSGSHHSNQYCHSWNEGHCRWPFGRCRFHHLCETCGRHHPSIRCPQHPTCRVLSQSPSQSKGGGPTTVSSLSQVTPVHTSAWVDIGSSASLAFFQLRFSGIGDLQQQGTPVEAPNLLFPSPGITSHPFATCPLKTSPTANSQLCRQAPAQTLSSFQPG